MAQRAHLTEREIELAENETDESFPPAERKIITQPYDLSVQTLLDQWHAEALILPETQREYVWDNARASRLIESLLLNIPIPVLYFAETADAKWEIIDGHQRIRSVVRYADNEFALSSLVVLAELKRLRFHQLPEREQRFLKTRTMRAVVISAESHENMKFEIFERLNTGAISLTAQELRNSIFRGPLNRLLHDLARETLFREAIGTKYPRGRMVDEELILRFFAMREGLSGYRPPLKTFLNAYMRDHQSPSDADLQDLRQVFLSTLARLHSIFDDRAFRIADSSGTALENAVNRAVFDAQMLAFSWVADDDLAANRDAILQNLATLYEDEEFLDAISRATGDRARTLFRVTAVTAALRESGLDVHAPRIAA